MVAMPERDVVKILDALDGAGVQFWVAGGWGIDALVGHQTRRHSDLDLILDRNRGDEEQTRRTLAELGVRFENFDAVGDVRLPRIIQLHDRGGRVVELIPVDLESLPVADTRHRSLHPCDQDTESDDRLTHLFAEGTIGSRAVACLAPEVQLALHQGYDLPKSNHRDLALL